jgi:hypothetical protein
MMPKGQPMSDQNIDESTTTSEAAETETVEPVDYKVEADRWRHHSRTNEGKLKAALKELDEIRQSQMSDQEKALEAARAEGRNSAVAEFGKDLTFAQITAEAAKAGVALPEGVTGFIDTSRLVGDDGRPNSDAISAFVNSFAAYQAPKAPAYPSASQLGLGPQGGSGPVQYTRDDLKRLSPAQINEAHEKGHLEALLNGSN